ncbi:MAG: WYL domain-containing protein [Bacilli bacterium]|nr:WYL domain-containing protein [Bacilli bacterium]
MSKISNVILMLQYLENGRKYNIKELSEKLEVSERMVRVYKEELEKAGIYIDTIMGPYGGYVLNQSIRIPTRKFTNEDYKFLHTLKVSEKDKERLEIIADKVHGVYFDSKNENLELKDEIKISYNILMRAIKEKRKVKINYYSYKHGNLDRIIRPYDMFLYNSGWGCAAFCELRNDLRHFELKRINKIDLLDEKF